MTWLDILFLVLYWAMWYGIISMLSIPILMRWMQEDDPTLWQRGPNHVYYEKIVLVVIILAVALIWPLWGSVGILKKKFS